MRNWALAWLLSSIWVVGGQAQDQDQEGEATETKGEAREEVQPQGIYFQYAIFYTPKPNGEPKNLAESIFHAGFEKQITLRTDVVKFSKGNYVEFREVERSEFSPPNEAYLERKGFGLNADLRKVVQQSETVLVLDFFIVQPEDYKYLSLANQLVLAVAKVTGGLIWDEETRELYAPQVWNEKRLAATHVAFANTSMHGYRLPSQLYRSVTFGMRKLGMPDMVMAEFPKAFWDPVSEMMQFLVTQVGAKGPFAPTLEWSGQTMAEALDLELVPDIPLQLIPAPRDEGDPRNDLLTVDFRKFPGESYQEKQLHGLSAWFQPGGELLLLWQQRDQLMKLSDQAREALKEKRAAWRRGLADGESLLVKAYLGEEYQWLRVSAWEEDEVVTGFRVPDITPEGRLTRPGAKAQEVRLDQVFDYLHVKANGEEEGNATGKLIRQIQQMTLNPGNGG